MSKKVREVIVESKETILIDFYAEWCGPCKTMTPVVDTLIEELGEDRVFKVNVDEDVALAQEYQVRGIPAFLYLKEGEVVERLSGFQSEESLKAPLKD